MPTSRLVAMLFPAVAGGAMMRTEGTSVGEETVLAGESSSGKSNYEVRALHRAIDVLESFSELEPELTLAEIADKTGLDRSTTRRLVLTLARRGLLSQSYSGRYRLGWRLFSMGGMVSASSSLRSAALGPLSQLENDLSGTLLLAAQEGDYFVILDRRDCASDGLAMVAMKSGVGTVRPLNYGPMGRVFLAVRSETEVREFLARHPLQVHTPYSVIDIDEFLVLLDRVRERGYDMDVNEVVEGIMSFVTPLFDMSGQTIGALCVGFPATREGDPAFLSATLTQLREAGETISANMGHSNANGRSVQREPVSTASLLKE